MTSSPTPAQSASIGASATDARETGAGAASALRTAPRLARVLRALARHGILGALRGKRHWPSPVQVREALEELGIVFLKFGQVLAVRRDILPDAYAAELERLHDRLPPMAFEIVRDTVEAELGGSLEELFANFPAAPLAAATIAQVHEATLQDGRHVVVKVRRSGLAGPIAEDVALLTYVAALAERLDPRLRSLDLIGMVREFRVALQREMNFRLEAQTIRRFRAALSDDERVWIPDVVAERSADAVLTIEYSPGQRIDYYAVQHPEMGRELAGSIATLLLHQVFENGLFHADPHPGNVFVLPDGRICLHDFGMIGELGEPMREALTDLLDATVRGDARDATDAYLAIGGIGADVDRPALEAELGKLLRQIRERPLGEISIGEALQSLFHVGARFEVHNPGVMLLLARAFLIAEALMRRLDPQLNVLDAFRNELQRVMVRRYSPDRLPAAGRRLVGELERTLRDAPADARRALRRIAEGELGRVHTPELVKLGQRMGRDVERLTGAVASAALLIAGALLITVAGWHRTAGDILLLIGIAATLVVALGALRRPR